MSAGDLCDVFRFVLNTCVIGSMCLLGLLGNIVSIVLLQKDSHNRVAVFLLQALAVADNSVLVVSCLVLSILYGTVSQLETQVSERRQSWNDYKEVYIFYITNWSCREVDNKMHSKFSSPLDGCEHFCHLILFEFILCAYFQNQILFQWHWN